MGLPSHRPYFRQLLQYVLKRLLDSRKGLWRLGFRPHDQCRLGVRSADEAPAVAEQDSGAVDVDNLIGTLEIFCHLTDDVEFHLVGTVDAYFWRDMVMWDVS